MGKINLVNPQAFIDELAKVNRGEKLFGELSNEDFGFAFSEVKPTEGYVIATNNETGEQFPYCCPFHTNLFEKSKKWFEEFPNCCEPHKKLLTVSWFKKETYKDVPMKIVSQFSYTTFHIQKQIETPGWYKDITDYIYYNITSFGQLPQGYGNAVGLHIYFVDLKDWIQKSTIVKDKKQKLIEYLETWENPATDLTNGTDLNLICNTYRDWLKIFPFELSYFTHLKQYFENHFPVLISKPELNIYSGLAGAKLHTKSSLIEVLINLTNSLLIQINGLKLHEKGLITDANKIKLELVINSRKLKLKQGYKNSSPNEEQRYRKMLKEWFNDEKRFIDEITPLLKVVPPQPTETKAGKLKIELDKYGFFDIPSVKTLSDGNKEKLFELISSKDLPYCIAMFEFLGFLKHLEQEHFQSKYAMNKGISKWFNSDTQGRTVKGNISSLLEYTNENKQRYTAHLHKETVQKDYQNLK